MFCELSGCDKSRVGTAPTPFLDESNDPLLVIEQPKVAPSTQVGATKGPKNAPSSQDGAVGAGTCKLSKIACTLPDSPDPTSSGLSARSLP